MRIVSAEAPLPTATAPRLFGSRRGVGNEVLLRHSLGREFRQIAYRAVFSRYQPGDRGLQLLGRKIARVKLQPAFSDQTLQLQSSSALDRDYRYYVATATTT